MKTSRYFMLALAVALSATAVGGEKKQAYIPMDYSTCGYHASEQTIPNATKTVVYVKAAADDNAQRIQKAIDYLATLKADAATGLRGTVLLGEGTFCIDSPLRISASGIILRGSGKQKTTILKRGTDRGAAIYIEGKEQWTKGDTLAVADQKVTAGSQTLTLLAAGKVKSGDRIQILRPSTKEWIQSLGCNDFGGGLDYTGWKPSDIDITWHRTVTATAGATITLDAPLTTTLTQQYGGAQVITSYNMGEISECGVENLTIRAEHNAWNPKDEDHCWDGVWLDKARDCWVRRTDFQGLAGSAVNMQRHTSRITVEDCIASEPVSEIGGWRRAVYLTRGEQNLVQRCVSREGIHDFVADYCAPGPNAFVQCEGEGSLGFSGSIGSWAAGLLFDIVNIEGNDIALRNMENWQMGTGWNSANSMLWQCTAATLWCYSPDDDNRSSANGCWGTMTGNAQWSSSNDHVSPRSLFYDQLGKRLGEKAIDGYILPRNTTASSSPTIEQAVALAQETLHNPRLTLEMWMDSVPYTASTSPKGAKDVDAIKVKTVTRTETNNTFAITNGHITCNGQLITGNRYAIPWWNGRTKDNFIEKSAKPAITRFVPGREGTGWTDRIDSVVTFLKDGGYCMLDQHYGLWYDLRRIDHERVRRADGEVSAPFYEQAVSRTGQGTAWDGLSKYDLTKPNEWYWSRLRQFAQAGGREGLLLFNQNYFQHNIIEAGAHWVDAPWRTANNVNQTSFPEPVPFTGDKRVFMAEQFYNEADPALRPLHEKYIRQCLDQMKDNQNVVQLVSEEYTGPLHFTRFWLETIAAWERETGRHPMIALSCTKDAQDSILADPELSKVVDIIDIRYWHYNTAGEWAPPAGKSMAPRQYMRKMKVGKTGYAEAYRAVREYREKYPDKAVTFFSQQYPTYGWAILMAGGSCPNIPVKNAKLLSDVTKMSPVGSSQAYDLLAAQGVGFLVYTHEAGTPVQWPATGNHRLWLVDKSTGETKMVVKSINVTSQYQIPATKGEQLYWFEKI